MGCIISASPLGSQLPFLLILGICAHFCTWSYQLQKKNFFLIFFQKKIFCRKSKFRVSIMILKHYGGFYTYSKCFQKKKIFEVGNFWMGEKLPWFFWKVVKPGKIKLIFVCSLTGILLSSVSTKATISILFWCTKVSISSNLLGR